MNLPSVPGYTLTRVIGAGRNATVYEARDAFGAPVAIKRLRVEDADREVTASIHLQASEYVAFPVDVPVEQGEIVYLPMPLFEQHLRDLAPKGLLPASFARWVALPVAKLARDCERAGVILTDLNPNNLMLHERIVQVVDLGSALIPGRYEDVEYTPTWNPPELLTGRTGPETLSWAFGALTRWAAGLYWHQPDVTPEEILQSAPWLGNTLARLMSECTCSAQRPRPTEVEQRFSTILRESKRRCGAGHACFPDARRCACGIPL